MLTTWRRTKEPTEEPVTLTQAKAHLNLDHTSDDTLVALQIQMARATLEEDTGRAFCEQEWELICDAWPDGGILELPRATPLISVDEIAYVDDAGAAQTLDLTDLIIDAAAEPGQVDFAAIDLPAIADYSRITISYTVGVAAADLSPIVKAAVLLLVGHYYANREAVVVANLQALTVPEGIGRLFHLLRIPR